jgi:hypothetical protein
MPDEDDDASDLPQVPDWLIGALKSTDAESGYGFTDVTAFVRYLKGELVEDSEDWNRLMADGKIARHGSSPH